MLLVVFTAVRVVAGWDLKKNRSGDMGVSKDKGFLNLGVLITWILLFGVLYLGPLFPETTICRGLTRANRVWGYNFRLIMKELIKGTI